MAVVAKAFLHLETSVSKGFHHRSPSPLTYLNTERLEGEGRQETSTELACSATHAAGRVAYKYNRSATKKTAQDVTSRRTRTKRTSKPTRRAPYLIPCLSNRVFFLFSSRRDSTGKKTAHKSRKWNRLCAGGKYTVSAQKGRYGNRLKERSTVTSAARTDHRFRSPQ